MDRVEGIINSVAKSYKYARSEPESALNFSRKAAEGICRCILVDGAHGLGKPKFNEMLLQLSKQRAIPPRMIQPFETVQKYGNYGSHSQDDAGLLDADYVEPCVLALRQIVAWFFESYLKVELPLELRKRDRRLERIRAKFFKKNIVFSDVDELAAKRV